MGKLKKWYGCLYSTVFCTGIILLPVYISAQNLVPNASFEEYINCPTDVSQIPLVDEPALYLTGWVRATGGTCDYFNSCNPGVVSVPMNFLGTQYARSGNGYVGIFTYNDVLGGDYREYLQTKLAQPMIATHNYYVGYWVSLAEKSAHTNVVATDQFGVYFSETFVNRPFPFNTVLDDITPQLKSASNDAFTDTAAWANISDFYKATGNEQWIVLGNFTPKGLLHPVAIKGIVDHDAKAYYYYDDVCVLDLDGGTPQSATTSETILCDGDMLIISGNDSHNVYRWNDGATTVSRPVTDTGIYCFYSVNKEQCLFTVDSFIVHGKTTVPINLGNDTMICGNKGPVVLNAKDSLFTRYSWSNGATDPSILVSEPGTYIVNASSDCYMGADTIVVTVADTPTAYLPQDTVICKDSAISLGYEQFGMSYRWSTGEEVCCIQVTDSGKYIWEVENVCGQIASDVVTIDFVTCEECILAPSAFSPNGDGRNDEFKIVSACPFEYFYISVYNRWGQLVFYGDHIGSKWDGTIGGKKSETGTYFYYINARKAFGTNKRIRKSGDLILMR